MWTVPGYELLWFSRVVICIALGVTILKVKARSPIGKDIEIRIPYVPDFNDCQINKIACFLAPFKNITKIRVLPYHNYAGSKYKALDIMNTLPERLPTDEEIQKVAENIKNITNFVVLF